MLQDEVELRIVNELFAVSEWMDEGCGLCGLHPSYYFKYFSRIISLISDPLYPSRAISLISSKYLSKFNFSSTNIRFVSEKTSKNSN